MKKPLRIITLLSLTFTGCKTDTYAELGEGLFAALQTNHGAIIIQLEYEKTPVTAANFITLAEGNNPFVSDDFTGKRYYDGLIFHRVIKDFMIQGGDPLGTGTGTPGYRFKDEFHDALTHTKGVLSMANSGPKTNGSQFFITQKATPWLDGRHTVFGHIVQGIEVVDTIAKVETGAQDKPKAAVVMEKVHIIRNGKAAQDFDAVQVITDYFAVEEAAEAALHQTKTAWVAACEQQKADAKTTASGLKIHPLVQGKGEKPKLGQKVLVHYAGWLPSGDLFDSNDEDVATQFNTLNEQRKQNGGYAPFPMDYSPEAQLIPGFKEGLQTMRVGDKVRLFIPSHLGYGAQGTGPIPPHSNLVFDVEIVGIQK